MAPVIRARSSSSALSIRPRASIRSQLSSAAISAEARIGSDAPDRALPVEHRAQREQVVAEALHRGLASAAHLEPRDCPGEGPVGVRARLELGRELGEARGLVLAQPVAARAGGGDAGRDPAPVAVSGRGEGVGAEADPAPLEEPHHADQLAKLAQGLGGGIRALALLGDRQELRLPGGAAHPLASHRLDRRLDRVGADQAHAVRKRQARLCHLQPDDRGKQDVGFVDLAGLGIEAVNGALEALAVERELGAAVP